MKKSYALDFFINIAIVVITLVLALLLTSLQFGDDVFSFAAMKESCKSLSFWVITVAVAVLGLMSYSSSYQSRFFARTSSDEYNNAFQSYKTAVDKKSQNFDAFKAYIKQYNLDKKMQLYIEAMQLKISKLEYKSGSEERIKALKAKLEPEYISANIQHTYVRGFTPVRPEYFKPDFGNSSSEKVKFVSHANQRYALALGTKGIGKVGSSIIFAGLTTFAAITFKLSPQFFVILASSAFTVITSIAAGIRFANTNFRREILDVLEDRTEFLQNFEGWLKKTDTAYYEKTLNDAVNAEIERRIAAKKEAIEKSKG